MSEKTTTAATQDEILLLAEKLGELSDRFAKIEGEFTAQTAPLDGSKAAIDGAVAALGAALTGIKALNFHVLDNNLGAVSKRVDEIAKQADVALAALENKIGETQKALASAQADTAKKFEAADAQRHELAAKRDEQARDFAAAIGAVKQELSQHLATLADSIKKFETPSSFNPRGVWDSLTEYRRLDVVELNGTSYVAAIDTKEKPTRGSKAWTTLARRGAASGGGGISDITGIQGFTPTGLQLAQASDAEAARDVIGVDDMVGATAGTAGEAGRVPQPVAGDQVKFLRGDGTFATPSVVTASAATDTQAIAGTDTSLYLTPASGSARALAGDITRAVAPYVLSDGATANRAGVATLNAATIPAGRTIQWSGPVYVPTGALAGHVVIAAFHTAANFPGGATPGLDGVNCVYVYFSAGSNTLTILQNGVVVGTDRRAFSFAAFRSTYSGRTVALSITIYGDSTTNPVVYADGVDISSSFTLTTGGTAPNWLPSTLSATYYVTGYNWPAGRAPVMEWGFGAWSAAEVATWAQTGIVPSWCAAATGSAVASYTSDFSAGVNAWDAANSPGLTLTGGESIGGESDALRVSNPTGAAVALQVQRSTTLMARRRVIVRGRYYAESGCGVPYLGLGFSGDRRGIYNSPVVEGSWQSITLVSDPALQSTTLALAGYSGAATSAAAALAAGKSIYLKLISAAYDGPPARWALQPACSVAPDSTTNGIPLLLTSGMTVAGDLPDHVAIQGNAMTADGFVLADQVLTDSRYELVGCNVRQTGTATSTITVRETSSGGSTVATGALSASVTRVSLTVGNSLLAGGKKLHLANSSWSGNTVTPFFIFRRCQMP